MTNGYRYIYHHMIALRTTILNKIPMSQKYHWLRTD